MKITTTKELEVNQGVPHYRWFARNEKGVTLESTRTRKEIRDFVRETKAAAKLPEVTS